MCTLSWAPERDGYRAWFSRDERRDRAMATPPTIRRLGSIEYVAPTDGSAGGTWIGLNQVGLALALLNRYDVPADLGRAYVSRGHLVASLIDSTSRTELRWRCAAHGLERFLPFTLVTLEPNRPALLLTWDGHRLISGSIERAGLLAASSSALPIEAEVSRRAVFARLVPEGATPEMFEHAHRAHEPIAGPLSICMHRDDAATVSLTRVHVTAAHAEMVYTPGAPCEGAAPSVMRIARQSQDPSRSTATREPQASR